MNHNENTFIWKAKSGNISIKDMTDVHLGRVKRQLLELDFTLFDTVTMQDMICSRSESESKIAKKQRTKNYLIKALQEVVKELDYRRYLEEVDRGLG